MLMNYFGKRITNCPLKQLGIPLIQTLQYRIIYRTTPWNGWLCKFTINLQKYVISANRLMIFLISSFNARAQHYFGEPRPPGG